MNTSSTPSADASAKAVHLLHSIAKAHSSFIHGANVQDIFQHLLNETLSLVDCEYGFMGEVLYDSSSQEQTPSSRCPINNTNNSNINSGWSQSEQNEAKGKPYLSTKAVYFCNSEVSEEFAVLLRKYSALGFRFDNMNTLFGSVITNRKPLLTNNPSKHPNASPNHIPPGHPPLKSFLGIPFLDNSDNIIGMLGIANKQGGFKESDIEFLEPFTNACTTVLLSMKEQELRKKYQEHLVQMNMTLEKRVALRTQELNAINEALHQEIVMRKQIEKQLMEAKTIAEEAVKEKSHFVATISHEIRTPLNAVLGIAQIMESVRPGGSDHLELTRMLKTSAGMLLCLVNNILDFSKLEAKSNELEARPLDLRLLLENVSEMISLKAHEKKLDLVLHVDDTNLRKYKNDMFPLGQILVGDSTRLSQIVQNLCSNAVKFTKQGFVKITAKIEECTLSPAVDIGSRFGRRLSTEQSDAMQQFTIKKKVTVAVQDSGIGINPEFIKRIGNPFSQADASITRSFGGTGLGLSIVKRLIEQMDGRLEIESTEKVGSIFRFHVILDCIPILASELGKEILEKDQLECQTAKEMRGLVQQKNLQFIIYDFPQSSAASLAFLLERVAQLDHLKIAKSKVELLEALKQSGSNMVLLVNEQRVGDLSDISSKNLLVVQTASTSGSLSSVLEPQGSQKYTISKPYRLHNLLTSLHGILFKTFGSKIEEGSPVPKLAEADIVFPSTIPEVKHKILVVDDNSINLKVAQRLIATLKRNAVIDTSSDAMVAVQMIIDNDYDLVLMDIMMPGCDGYECTVRAQEGRRQKGKLKTKIVALSGCSFSEKELETMDNCGMISSTYLMKPLSSLQLEHVFQHVLSP